jgi:Fe-S oxidoreductase
MKDDKPTKQDRVEANNLIEEIGEILEPCVKCGMCKSLCPVFKVLREESASPRGKICLLSDEILDKIVFHCNLCKACETQCPLNVKVCDAIRKAREAMVLKGKGLSSNKEMIDNVRKSGNPFGKMTEDDKKKLYCC